MNHWKALNQGFPKNAHFYHTQICTSNVTSIFPATVKASAGWPIGSQIGSDQVRVTRLPLPAACRLLSIPPCCVCPRCPSPPACATRICESCGSNVGTPIQPSRLRRYQQQHDAHRVSNTRGQDTKAAPFP